MQTEKGRVLLLILYGFLTFSAYSGALLLLYRRVSSGNCSLLPYLFGIEDVCSALIAWTPLDIFSLAGAVLLTFLFGYVFVLTLQRLVRRSHSVHLENMGVLAHDLRTPLTILTARTEILLLDPAIDSQARKVHEGTMEELSRINSMISEALIKAQHTSRS